MSQTLDAAPSETVVDFPTSAPMSTDPADNQPQQTPQPEPEASEEPELPEGVAAKQPPAGKEYPKWEMERIRAMTRINNDQKRQMAELQEQIRVLQAAQQRQDPAQTGTQPEQPGNQSRSLEVFTQQQLEARAAEIAQQRVQQQTMENELRSFGARGASSFQDWGEKVAAFEQIGGLDAHPEFIKAVMSLPNGEQVLYTLGSNLDQANFVLNNLSGMQQAMALAQLSGSLAAATPDQGQAGQPAPLAAAQQQQISRAPAPTRSIAGRPAVNPSASIYDPKISMEDYVKMRAKGS